MDHVDFGLKLFIPHGFFFVFENNMAQRKVYSYCSSKVHVPRLEEGREAEQNSDEDDNEKKDCIFQNTWLSKQMPIERIFSKPVMDCD